MTPICSTAHSKGPRLTHPRLIDSRLSAVAWALALTLSSGFSLAQAPAATGGTAPAAQLPPLRNGAGASAAEAAPAAPALPAAPVPTPEMVPAAPQLAAPAHGEAAPAVPEPAGSAPQPHGDVHAAPPVGHEAAPQVAPAGGFTGAGVPDTATAPLPPFPGHEGAHGAAAGHGAQGEGGHGGGHHGPVIENWVSWDYGPGKTHHNPPFLFAIINFAVFAFLLSRLFGKSFKTFLENRHGEVRHALDRAQHVQKEAEEQLKQIEGRIQGLQAEMDELLASYRKQAEAERQAIVKRAEDEAASLLRDAEAQAQAAIASAKRTLEEKAALLAVDLAEKLLRSRLREEDHKRLTEQYVAQVEGLSLAAGKPTGGAAPQGKEQS